MASPVSHVGSVPLPGTALDLALSARWRAALALTISILLVTRLGRFIPLPGIDLAALGDIARQPFSSLAFDATARTSIFALSLTPFVTAWVLVEIFRGSRPQREIARFRRWLTFALAAFQSFGFVQALQGVRGLVDSPGPSFVFPAALTLLAGTMLLMWLGEQITRHGICDGIWLIVAADTIAELPRWLDVIVDPQLAGSINTTALAVLAAALVLLIAAVVTISTARRTIPLEEKSSGEPSALHVKLDNVTILPAAMSSVLISVPTTFWGIDSLSSPFSRGTWSWLAAYALLIVITTFLATALRASPRAMARRLSREGLAVHGVPQSDISGYLDHLMTRLTIVAAGYMLAVFALPELLSTLLKVPVYVGGTSFLIVTLAMLDILARARDA